MLKYYKTVNNRLEELDDIEDGCWIEATAPTEAEISKLEHELSVDRDFIRAALDEEETSRIENEEGQVLIVLDYPVAERAVKAESKQRRSRFKKNRNADNEPFTYYTVPMGIIHTSNNVITVSLKSNPILEDFAHGVVKGFRTDFRTQFTFHILLRVAGKYLQYLKQIDKLSGLIESRLLSSMHNKELIQLMGLEKSLVYFSASLKSNEAVLDKVLRGKYITLYDEDQDLLEDVIIEVKQAIEMSNIFSNILSGTADAFSGIISNNLNNVMKVLTVITIVMAMPTMVFSFYGMNVDMLPFVYNPLPALAIAAALAIIAAVFLTKNKFYK